MNVKFTANMEKELDKVEEGTVEWVQLLRDFYSSLEKDIVKFEKEIDEIKKRRVVADVMDSEGNPMILKTGLYGKYLISEANEKEKISLKGIPVSPEEIKKGEIFVKEAVEKLQNNKKGIPTDYTDENGVKYVLKVGRYGEYLESENYETDEKRMSLPLELKQKYRKGSVIELDGVLQINEEMKRLYEIDKKLIEEAGVCEFCGRPYEIKVGRYGKFLACTGYPECKTIKNIKTGKVTKVTEKEEKAKTKKNKFKK